MKISELIHHLSLIADNNGDLECEDAYGDTIGIPEAIDGVCVVADKA